MKIRARSTRQDIGVAGSGDMLLREMFSPIGAPTENDIDFFNDLKFFMDNDNELMTKVMFPAIINHKNHVGNKKSYKFYIAPIDKCITKYCEKFNIDKPNEVFPKGKVIEFAKMYAEAQEKFITNGAYE